MSKQIVAHLRETPEHAVYQEMHEHYPACPTCMAADDEGKNLNLPCETGDRLYQDYRRVRRGGAALPEGATP
jgi:hypothetical protein